MALFRIQFSQAPQNLLNGEHWQEKITKSKPVIIDEYQNKNDKKGGFIRPILGHYATREKKTTDPKYSKPISILFPVHQSHLFYYRSNVRWILFDGIISIINNLDYFVYFNEFR